MKQKLQETNETPQSETIDIFTYFVNDSDMDEAVKNAVSSDTVCH